MNSNSVLETIISFGKSILRNLSISFDGASGTIHIEIKPSFEPRVFNGKSPVSKPDNMLDD